MVLNRVRIRPGVLVGQDHGWFRWPGPYDARTSFRTERLTPTLWALCAPGFGVFGKDTYGNGAIYLYDDDRCV